MSRAISPLRYPGGKACLLNKIIDLIKINKFEKYHYAEPYAGGCGLALGLLYEGYVSNIYINDIDFSIWSFWYSILHHTKEFIQKIIDTDITIEEWHKQKEIYHNHDKEKYDILNIGFSTFFLNRTNRSGIIGKAGAIGGIKQNGNYKIDCRFTKNKLIERILKIEKYKEAIKLSHLDAVDFLEKSATTLPFNTFFCIDPPYYNKGSGLYTNFYTPSDHETLSKKIPHIAHPWIITYDNTPEIQKLYQAYRQIEFQLNYSVQTKRLGTEIMIVSTGLKIPSTIEFSAKIFHL